MKKPQRMWDANTGQELYLVDWRKDMRDVARRMRRIAWLLRILFVVNRIKSAALSLFDSLMGRC